MRLKLSFLILFAASTARAQLIITTTLPDSILYNTLNYVQATTQQQANNGVHTVVYNNITNPAYQMKKMYMQGLNHYQKHFTLITSCMVRMNLTKWTSPLPKADIKKASLMARE